ncbi:MAG: M1 family metallopeptidase [Bacteroidota bacterium]
MKKLFFLFLTFMSGAAFAQGEYNAKFEQLGSMLPTPNSYRTASGAPGPDYWQNRADYKISVTLNDENQSITGSETIKYYNNSPSPLDYLWVQLDQNMRAQDSNTPLATTSAMRDTLSSIRVQRLTRDYDDFDGGFKIKSVTDEKGKDLRYSINKTMMRVEMPSPLNNGGNFTFNIDWSYNINDRMDLGGRSGYEYFPEEDNYLYTIAQFYPRMAAYDDVNGWQNKQFLGRGEFTLSFGDFEVDITVPEDHIVASSGTLENADKVLTKTQRDRFEQAKKTFDKPVIIVTQAEAEENEKTKATKTKTWTFKADNVRDFAFATSRKFIWDAQAVKLPNGTAPLAMSYYPKEGNPLWEEQSTLAVKNTLETFSKYSVEYPYPVAISVHTAAIGMEYPMICFNYGRPDADGNYSDRIKYGMISVIIHEVGHNFFPMIINSDERQWTWMDEGLNTFLQYRTEQEQYTNYPSRRGPAANIVPYMKGDKEGIRPIMTNSEQILQFGNNAYAKPATALNILRETVMGPELFDYAFKEYSTRWAFKNPMPADFFRSMEDASAVDLDWFWKGWFFTNDHVDMAIDNVKWYRMQQETDEPEKKIKKSKKGDLSKVDEAGKDEKAKNFADAAETFVFQEADDRFYFEFQNRRDDERIMKNAVDKNFYEVTFKNKGGLVMPIVLEWTFADGSTEIERIPAEIWRMNENEVTKVFVKDKEVTNIVLDPYKELADTEVSDNLFPRVEVESKFDKFKDKSN